MSTNEALIGSIASLWRYPVKSMQGEELNEVQLSPGGVLGDRQYALIDVETGNVISAKHTRKWNNLLDFQARFFANPTTGTVPPVELLFPDGHTINSSDPDCDTMLSQILGAEVTLTRIPPNAPSIRQFWPEKGETTEEAITPGTFFDVDQIHLVTTATLRQLQNHHPNGDYSSRRFRPNLVIATPELEYGFVENDWIGRELVIGDTVRLKITTPTVRCVMTTLSQPGLSSDIDILRTLTARNNSCVGVYAKVLQMGPIQKRDQAFLK